MTNASDETQRIIIDHTNSRLDELRGMIKEVATTTTETRVEVAVIKNQITGLCTHPQLVQAVSEIHDWSINQLTAHCRDNHSKPSFIPRSNGHGKLYKLLGRIAGYLAVIGGAIWGIVELLTRAAPKP